MHLPFSRQDFLQVFARYNPDIWPLQAVTAGLGMLAVALAFSGKPFADRTISGFIALFWAVTGIGYHWLYFADVNPAAYLFGGLFLAEAALFLVEGVIRDRIRFRFRGGLIGWLASALLVYALILYPLLGLTVTHPYPETPLFGVAPCPTTIFTLGMLMIARCSRPMLLAALPLLWSAIGGSAAILLDVPQDWGLIVAAGIWVFAWRRERLPA